MGTRRSRGDAAERVLETEYEPIVDLGTGRIAGFEALTTFNTRLARPPEWWLAKADARGLRVALDSRAISQALDALVWLPRPLLLVVRSAPATVCSGCLQVILTDVDADRVVIEVSALDSVHDYDAFHRSAADLRALGTRVAVDSVGSRIDHMAHVVRLHPDIIKLDRSVVRAAASGGSATVRARGAVHYAEKTDIAVIAEGVSTLEEMQAARALGVRFGQGPLLSTPSPLEDWRQKLGLDERPDAA